MANKEIIDAMSLFQIETKRAVPFDVYYIPLNSENLEEDTRAVQRIFTADENFGSLCDPEIVPEDDTNLAFMRCLVPSGTDKEFSKLNEELLRRPTRPQMRQKNI